MNPPDARSPDPPPAVPCAASLSAPVAESPPASAAAAAVGPHAPASRGLVLFAHGARDPRWAQPFEAVAQRVRAACPGVPVQSAYLEFLQPDLAAAVADLVAHGCRHIDLLPMFLGAGGHVRKDVPARLEALRQAHPGLTIQVLTAIGEVPAVIEAMASTAVQALSQPPR